VPKDRSEKVVAAHGLRKVAVASAAGSAFSYKLSRSGIQNEILTQARFTVSILKNTEYCHFSCFPEDNAFMNWSVYIILSTDNTLYTGITVDVPRRIDQHATGKGAKYFRGRQPEQLVYVEPGHNRSSATKREIDLKKMNQEQKSHLITSDTNKIREVVS